MKRVEYRVMYESEDGFWWYVGMRRATAALLDRYVGAVGRVLDAGCGTGANLIFLARYGRPVGVDLSREALRFAATRRPEAIARASVGALPFADESFDLVTSFEVLYHLAVEDDRLALAEMARVTRRGGWLLVRVPAYDWLRGAHDRAVHTRHRYTAGELRAKLRETGLEVVRISYLNTTLFPMAAAKRALEWATASSSGESDVKPLSPMLNQLFAAILAAEGQALRWADLPFGLSVLALARKP
ncbi:MAG: class I SAM-dependent methyltransferase [Chloroflexota bacterium]|nr:class I SAM-dependent methyltransferase [Dehalococcoidia bacterium]MDW8252805.1 class I SAM-dependent methyltransferase [Chloroflexota bacterium]